MPPSASANRPFLLAVAPVNAPRTWPNSSASSSVSGIAAQLTLMSGCSRCGAAAWMARATSSLPVPVSPVISTVLLVCATSSARLDHVLHPAAAADDAVVVELLVALAEQVAVLRAQALVLDGAVDDDQQLVDLERLLQVVERAQLHRRDRALDRGVRGHHQDLRPLALAAMATEVADEVEAGQVGHQVVDQQHVEDPLVEQPPRLARARRWRRRRGLPRPGRGQERADLRLVVDEQDGAGRLGGALTETPNYQTTNYQLAPRFFTRAASAAASGGSSVPAPGSASTSMRPPRPSTMFLVIARPMPDAASWW